MEFMIRVERGEDGVRGADALPYPTSGTKAKPRNRRQHHKAAAPCPKIWCGGMWLSVSSLLTAQPASKDFQIYEGR
jgi:hypothetical protein